MTEAEWDACTDPQAMLEFLRSRASERKLRLFAVAFCRRIMHLLCEKSRDAVDIAEKHADAAASDQELKAIHDEALETSRTTYLKSRHEDNAGVLKSIVFAVDFASDSTGAFLSEQSFKYSLGGSYLHYIAASNEAALVKDWSVAWERGSTLEKAIQRQALHDIFGPFPFRPIAIDQRWLTAPVTALATTIYNDRTFDLLPILADALEDAGCHNQHILEHCRGGGGHVRGCWVVDLLLGKE